MRFNYHYKIQAVLKSSGLHT